MENKGKIFCPSFEVERKTKALNKYVSPFVAVISMFTVGCGILAFYTFMTSFLGLVTYNFFVYIFVPVAMFVILVYKMIQMELALRDSYKFEDGKIIRGRIQLIRNTSDLDNIIDSALVIDALKNIGDYNVVSRNFSIINIKIIINSIKLNMDKEFTEKFFDTELYDKKEYNNPKLIGENQKSLIYMCDNNEKLVIPKIYNGMCDIKGGNEISFGARVIVGAIIVFIIAFVISIIDLSVRYVQNPQYVSNINVSKDRLKDNYLNFGYVADNFNEEVCTYIKENTDQFKTSEVKYYFDKNGNVEDVDIQLYYEENSKNVEEELRYIISTLDAKFNSSAIDNFVNIVNDNLNGNQRYGKLVSNKYSLSISRSGKYIQINKTK